MRDASSENKIKAQRKVAKYIVLGAFALMLLSFIVYLLMEERALNNAKYKHTPRYESYSHNSNETLEIIEEPLSKSDMIKKTILELPERLLLEAIESGKLNEEEFSNFTNNYLLPVVSNTIESKYHKEELQPIARIVTPYYLIALNSNQMSEKYKEYSLEEASMHNSWGMLSFYIRTYGGSIDMTEDFHVVLKQGDNIMQPSSIGGQGEFASRSRHWPDFPAYTKFIGPTFNVEDIDFSKEAELVFLYNGKEESVNFKVDFRNYK